MIYEIMYIIPSKYSDSEIEGVNKTVAGFFEIQALTRGARTTTNNTLRNNIFINSEPQSAPGGLRLSSVHCAS